MIHSPVLASATITLLLAVTTSVECFSNHQKQKQPSLSSASLKTLRFVAIITRHGSRSPLSTYPNDPYPFNDSTFWPNGPKELSNLGKVELYHTGQYLRGRYQGFVDRLYNPNSTEVRYNPYNRDYASAACLTAGMYPPVGPQIWNILLNWQPVVQSSRDFDICDLATNGECPKYMKLFNNVTEEFNKNSENQGELLNYISSNAGTNYTKLSQVYDIYDTLMMQVQNGFKAPQWTKKIFPSIIRPIAVDYLTKSYSANKELIQLGAGPELKFVGDKMTMKANGTSDERMKFYIEAAHDCSLIALLKALGDKNPELEIHTGAFLLFELHFIDPDYIVQTYYFRSSYDTKPQTINIEGCPDPCSIENFNKFVDSLNPTKWEEACKA